MRATRVAINGYGRIGRLVHRALLEDAAPLEVVAINDLASPEVLAHLQRYDSLHGRFPGEVAASDGHLVVNGRRIRVLSEKDPAKLPWRELDVDVVVEATGRFTKRADLDKHREAGARRVILTAPGDDVDVTLVRGVNMHDYDPARHRLISNASCTTNCLAPILKVLDEAFGIEHAHMTTVHAYTNDQNLLDGPHKDLRRARAAGLSMIPTSTGAAKAIHHVLPTLRGRVDGLAVRVPIATGSLLDLSVHTRDPVTAEDAARAFEAASMNGMRGILGVARDPLVSADFVHDPLSAVVDLPALTALGERRLKVLAWYDNEWAYSKRTAELVRDVAAREPEAGVAVAAHAPATVAGP